ncbi:MAG: ribosome maturation factor RimP [Acidobacteriota bacterium]|nr:ribosome maturation factor RimP [Acidobacteriota bacterium]
MSKQTVNEKIAEIATDVAKKNGLELVQAQVVGSGKSLTIRVFIDKPEGVTHEDCALMSRQLDTILDTEDFIPSAYLLEVSSPGLERELYSLQDFKRFTGSPAKIKTSQAVDGQKNFRGRIIVVEGEDIVFDDKTKGTVRFAYDIVLKANLEIDIEEEFKLSEKRKAESEK